MNDNKVTESKENFLNWFSLTKMMELSVIASAIAVIITGLFTMDYFSQESKIVLDLEGPVHGVVKPRFIQYFKERNLPIPGKIKLDSLLSADPSYTAGAFLKKVPVDNNSFRLEKLPEEGNSISGLLKWLGSNGDGNFGVFVKTQECEEVLGQISSEKKNNIFSALVSSTVSAMRLIIFNAGTADATDVTLNISRPYSKFEPLWTSDTPGEIGVILSPGELLRIEGLGQNLDLSGKNTFAFNLRTLKKGQTETIKIYTVGGPIQKGNIAISKSDKPRFDKTLAIITFILSEILILALFILVDTAKFVKEKKG